MFWATSSELHIRSLDHVTYVQSAVPSWSRHFLHRLNLPMRSFIIHIFLHLISFCRFPYRQSLLIRLCEIFGIPADMLSNLTLFSSLSIPGQIDWHAWLTFPWLGEQLPSDSSVLIFASTHLLVRPVGHERFNMVELTDKSAVSEEN